MNITGMKELLAEMLNSQVETGKFGVIEVSRLKEALTTGPDFTENEKSILLISPVARDDYLRLRKEISQQILNDLETSDISNELLPLAAATDEDTIVMEGNGFDVILYKKEDLGIPWLILVQLHQSFLDKLNPMTVIRLVDSGGLEWLRGRPDSSGEIMGSWEDIETDILARSKRYSLFLEPV